MPGPELGSFGWIAFPNKGKSAEAKINHVTPLARRHVVYC
jgi:hypothetical protein